MNFWSFVVFLFVELVSLTVFFVCSAILTYRLRNRTMKNRA